MPDSTFAGATVMSKVADYNPEHQDWLFAKYDPRGTPEDFGRAAMCQECHQQAKMATSTRRFSADLECAARLFA